MSAGFLNDVDPTVVKTHNSIALTYALNAATTAIGVTYKKTGTADTPTTVPNIAVEDTTFTLLSLSEGTLYTINFKLTSGTGVTNLPYEIATRGFLIQPTLTNISDISVTLEYEIKDQADFIANLITGDTSTPITIDNAQTFTLTKLTYENLTNGTSYTIDFLFGNFTKTFAFSTLGFYNNGVPTRSSATFNSITLTFDPGPHAVSATYQKTLTIGSTDPTAIDSSLFTLITSTQYSLPITSLEEGTSYTFFFTLTSSIGGTNFTWNATPIAFSTLGFSTKPTAGLTANSIVVTYTIVDLDSISVEYRKKNGGGIFVPAPSPASKTEVTLENLDEGATYEIAFTFTTPDGNDTGKVMEFSTLGFSETESS